MTRTLTRSYMTNGEAQAAVTRLEAANIAGADISIIAKQADLDETRAAEGAGIGGIVGGAVGVLAGIGMLAIPGIGPVVAAGWLATATSGLALGAVAGGLVGMLVSAGIDEEDANYYAETLRRGGSVVAVKVDDDFAVLVEAILDDSGSIDRVTRRDQYKQDGWTRFDDKAAPYTGPQI
jgi:hypothetical protein